MIRSLFPWPMLLIWLAVSATLFLLGSGFVGSLRVLPGSPPAGDPLETVIWTAGVIVIYAPFVLIPARLLSDGWARLRTTDAAD